MNIDPKGVILHHPFYIDMMIFDNLFCGLTYFCNLIEEILPISFSMIFVAFQMCYVHLQLCLFINHYSQNHIICWKESIETRNIV
jgi:hypothetical protein